MKTHSITQKLVLTIITPVITILMAVGIYNYLDTKSILNKMNKNEQSFIANEIMSFIELQFVSLDIIEEPIQQQMEGFSQRFINEFYIDSVDITQLDLSEIRRELGMDSKLYDLYIIDTKGEVVNTTYKDDLGINFFNFGEVHKRYLQNIFSSGDFDSPKFFFEDKTKRYKKYSYQATKDKKYIFEIGLYSNQADRIFDYMINHLNKLASQRDNLSEIDLFFWLDEPTSLDQKKTFYEEHLSILDDFTAEKNIKRFYTDRNQKNLDYTYVYVKNINSKLIKGAIVRIKHDSSQQALFAKKELVKFITVLFIALILMLIIAFFINPMGKVIKNITSITKELALGNLNIEVNNKLKNRKDELGELSTAIKTLITGLKQTADFADKTGRGNLDEKHDLLSENDVLGKTLIQMQTRLNQAKISEEEKIKTEQKQKFISDGLAHFGDVLRLNIDNIDKLSYNITKELVNYLDVPVGALFLIENEDNELVIESKATIAYGRQKKTNQIFKLGEGLIGQCAYEKDTIYLKEIPENYIQITSGLGDANPRNILIVPLIADENIQGVVEIAAFNEIQDHHITFVEKLAESIASTVSSVQLNQKTVQLLDESKKQREELSAKEEVMRQNVEELQATQEEAANRESKLSSVLSAIDVSVFVTQYKTSGEIIEVNSKYLDFLECSAEALEGKSYRDEAMMLKSDSSKIDNNWSSITNGSTYERVTTCKDQNIKEFYYPVKSDKNNLVERVIKVSYPC